MSETDQYLYYSAGCLESGLIFGAASRQEDDGISYPSITLERDDLPSYCYSLSSDVVAHAHETVEDAIAEAENFRSRKVAELQEEIDRLNSIEFRICDLVEQLSAFREWSWPIVRIIHDWPNDDHMMFGVNSMGEYRAVLPNGDVVDLTGTNVGSGEEFDAIAAALRKAGTGNV